MSDPRDVTSLALAEHAAFLRALARGLVGDEHLAEDVVQATWTAALARPSAPESLGGWTARVARNVALKLRRGAQRRERRELAVARPEAQEPEVEAVVEREELLAALTAAVLALDEPYRATILQRYYEGLEPNEIARRTGVPVATVKSRLARALERLRERLDRAHGARNAWSAGLISLAGLRDVAPAGGAAGALKTGVVARELAGGIVVSTKGKLAVVGALVLLVALAVWTADGMGGGTGGEDGANASLAASVDSDAGSSTRSAQLDGSEPGSAAGARAAIPAPAVRATGSLVIQALWKRDRSPAAGVFVHVHADEGADPVLDVVHAQTDEKGIVRVSEVPAGGVRAYGDRGGSASVVLEPGGTARVEVLLSPGVDVDGRVVDSDGRAVADADIWLSDVANGSEGRVAARSDGTGRFRLPSVPSNSVVARKAGYVPSPEIQPNGAPGTALDVELVLGRPGSALHVRVLDRKGRPVAGALVRCEEEAGMPPDSAKPASMRTGRIPVALRTEADGFARLEGLAPGDARLVVRAADCAPIAREVELASGETKTLDVRLQRGVALHGAVKGEDGRPISGVLVRVGRLGDATGRWVRTDASGAFRLAALAPGTIDVVASATGAGRAEARLTGVNGAEIVWNATIDAGLVLRGRLVDARGVALASWHVGFGDPGSAPNRFSGSAQSDADGRFAIPNCPDRDLRLLAIENPLAWTVPEFVVTGVRAGGDERTFTVGDESRASASVTGRVLDAQGNAVATVVCLLHPERESAGRVWSDAQTGAFTFGGIPAATYALEVRVEGRGYRLLRDVQVAAGQKVDLGEVRLGGNGRLIVEARDLDGLTAERIHVSVSRADGGSGEPVHETLDTALAQGGYELLPGAWTVHVGGFALPEQHHVEVREGEVTTLEIRPRAGAQLTMFLTPPREGGWPQHARAVFRAGDRTFERDLYVNAIADDPRGFAHAVVPPGAWELALTCKNGWTVTTALSAEQIGTHAAPATRSLELTLH